MKRRIVVSLLGFSSFKILSQSQQEEKYYSYKDVSEHDSVEKRIWVTYKDGVYDITNYIHMHPGGSQRILMAAGKQIDPYWEVYKQHTKSSFVVEKVLSLLRIGKLKDYDPDKTKDFKDPFMNEPIRDHSLKVQQERSFNAETPVSEIPYNWITPNDIFYVRNTFPVPDLKEEEYKIKVEGVNIEEKEISLKQLKEEFKEVNVISTIQCGGNRRSELNKLQNTLGLTWGVGAISNAEWKGVKLRDVIKSCMIDKEDYTGMDHVHFESHDGFKVSIPIEKALNEFGDVLLSYAMNGEQIPRDHGYPLRVIVPGYVGVRNLKFLKNIKIQNEEMDSEWQRGISYKQLAPYVKNMSNVDLSKIQTMQEMPVQSCIVEVKPSQCEEKVQISGFAYSGGGRSILRVDLSLDGGSSFLPTELKQGSEQKMYRAWAWTFWTAEVKKPKGKFQVVCKAVDSAGNQQPQNIDQVWNIRGLNNNSWHRIDVDQVE